MGKKSSTKRELESLVGKLGHAARVVPPGKTFMRRMFELMSTARKPHHRVRLSREFQSDLAWWSTFLDTWNGVSIIRDRTREQASRHIWTDASGSFGCGAWDPAGPWWIQLVWPSCYRQGEMNLKEESITLKESPHCVGVCSLGAEVDRFQCHGPL